MRGMGRANLRCVRVCWSLKVALALAVFAVAAPRSGAQIQWRSGARDAPTSMTPQQIVNTIEQARIPDEQLRLIVRFSAPISDNVRADVDAVGLHLLTYLDDNAYFATVRESAFDDSALALLSEIDYVQTIESAHKLHPALLSGDIPDHAYVGTDAHSPQERIVGLYAVFHPDVSLDEAAAVVAQHQAVVRDRLETVNGLVIELPVSQIQALAQASAVQWVEPPLPKFSTTNAENRALTQADVAQQAPYNLDGSGVTALIYDGGSALAGHADFSGRLTVIDGDGLSDHATHVSGTVGGDGSITFNYRGMAPGVTLLSAGFEYDGSGIFLYSNPGDVEVDYANAISQGAVLTNNSIGSNVESNGFSCSIQGDYGVMSTVIDAIVRGSLGEPLIVVWANGNERQGSGCDVEGFGDYYSIAPPATAKNHITVGALNANDDSMTTFSSWGPTDDGRMKPDIAAPGCQNGGDDGVTSTNSAGNYNVKCGTSMASPTVCGLTALLLEDFRAQFPGFPDPLASTVKVLLAHSAVDLGNVGPDYQFGYGSVRIADTIDLMRLGQFTEQSISQGAVQGFQIEVAPGTQELRFTLAWSDPPGTANVEPALVNDLDLRAVDPLGGMHYPWTLDPLNPSAAATKTQPNTLDNIEQVLVDSPMSGDWTVEVIGTNVPDGPQVYSLVGTPEFLSYVAVGLTENVPELVAPGEVLMLGVSVTEVNDSIIPGSEKLYYRFDGGAYTEIDLAPDGDDYLATIPGANCNDVPEFYLSVEGQSSGEVFSPPDGAASPFNYGIGAIEVLYNENFEIDNGWTVTNAGGLTDGAWDRGVPIGGGDRGDPPTDADGSGQCYLTDNVEGNSDVDDGSTTLSSPTIDASGEALVLSYYRWFSNNTGDGPETDAFTVDVSDNGGLSWIALETVGPSGEGISGGWFNPEFVMADIPGFVPNEQFRIRFTAEDIDPQSVVEAAVDGIMLSRFVCEDPEPQCPADIDGDDAVTVLDLLTLLAAWGPCPPPPCPADVNSDGEVGVQDLLDLLADWGPCL